MLCSFPVQDICSILQKHAVGQTLLSTRKLNATTRLTLTDILANHTIVNILPRFDVLTILSFFLIMYAMSGMLQLRSFYWLSAGCLTGNLQSYRVFVVAYV